ncbi:MULTISPECIES: hypothetical protein [Halobacteriovorax]|uniref:Uncharacterized protein n=1 Tax=Halobacteriovorax vibrionivorans TaxID=2152716 RepID=A0ABY0IL13_9BACT|nr:MULTISPECIES: hypothetical protein [Halobacteriovorax]RZF22561.1 hypothetical protein DAY19_01965 [Halobacteriovorax vibrionivorans]TGD47753.1 hypothetical protein EP118_07330 [Halobacteriovorax sp. Y22]
METLKEFRPDSIKKYSTTTKKLRKSRTKSKKSSASIFSTSNIALLVGVLLLGYGKYQSSVKLKKKNQIISSMSQELDKLKMEKMKYMADKKIQAIASQTLDSKKSHIESLKAIVAKSKSDLTKVSNELSELKKLKMTELQYKTKLAQIEKDYQQRLDAHNLDSTRTIKKMGRQMMAEVDKIKTRAPASASTHVVNYKSFKKVNKSLKAVPAKSSHGDLEVGEWHDSSMEF